jgi:dsRNA-specific ribonuclease
MLIYRSVQLKLPKPEYNFEEQTIDNGTKIFVCTASIRDISVQDSGASKKRAKNSAAKLMYEKLYNIKEQDG